MAPSRLFRILKAALSALSPLVPREHRDRWLKEWEGELHHRVSTVSTVSALGGLSTAFRDALHLLIHRPRLQALGPESVHPPRYGNMLSTLLADLRFGFRALRSAPGFSAITILTLALGIGASVALFGVLHAVFLRPLPFPDPQELVVGRSTFEGELGPWVSGADYYDYRDESEAFRELAAILPFAAEMTVTGEGGARRVPMTAASPNLLAALGVTPVLGRSFAPEEGLDGAEDVVLLSHSFWMNRLGGDPGAVGKSLALDGNPYTVLGVLPPDFFFMAPTDLWVPMRPDRMAASSRSHHNWYVVGRLANGVTREQAQVQVDAISLRLQEAYPETNEVKGLRITGLREVLTEDYRLSLWLLSAAVALVLLVACGNGAGILLARAPARRFELSVRAAMGAPRGRLIRQLLGESLLLSLAAGLVGTGLAAWFQSVMLEYLSMTRLGLEGEGISIIMLGAALGLSLLAGLLAGVYPALQSATLSATEGLKTGHRGVGGGGTAFRSGLVVAQVAISITLLAGSGLMIRSLGKLRALDPGFDASGVMTAEIQLPNVRYPTPREREAFFADLIQGALAIPGVQQASLTSHLPIGDFGNTYRASAQGSADEAERIFLRAVLPGYFETVGIPLISGRDLDDTDGPGSPWVVILSQTAAQRLFPHEDALGMIVELPFSPNPRLAEVVGIVGDVRLSRLEEEPEAAVYVPYAHHARTEMRLALQTLATTGITGGLGELVQRMDPEVPVSRVVTLESLVSESMAERRVITLALTLLALLPLVLASVGLFALLAYHVSRRKHEIGVRMALGAQASQVSGMILKEGMRLVGMGVVLGLAGALSGTRLLHGLIFGIETTDPLTLMTVVGVVMGVAVLASALPAWRAIQGDPRAALEAD